MAPHAANRTSSAALRLAGGCVACRCAATRVPVHLCGCVRWVLCATRAYIYVAVDVDAVPVVVVDVEVEVGVVVVAVVVVVDVVVVVVFL